MSDSTNRRRGLWASSHKEMSRRRDSGKREPNPEERERQPRNSLPHSTQLQHAAQPAAQPAAGQIAYLPKRKQPSPETENRCELFYLAKMILTK